MTFFIDGMDCIELKRTFSFDISHINNTANVLANILGYVPNEVVSLFEIEDIARSNAKVLSLGKKVLAKFTDTNNTPAKQIKKFLVFLYKFLHFLSLLY